MLQFHLGWKILCCCQSLSLNESWISDTGLHPIADICQGMPEEDPARLISSFAASLILGGT